MSWEKELNKRHQHLNDSVNSNSDFASCSEPELEISAFCSYQGKLDFLDSPKEELRRKARHLETRMRKTTTKLKLTQGKVRTRRENKENEIEALNYFKKNKDRRWHER